VRSLRRTLALWLLGIGFAFVVLALGASYVLAERTLSRQFDRGLSERAASLATLLEQVGEEVELHFSDELMTRYSATEEPEYFEVWIGERLLERSVSLVLAQAAPLRAPDPTISAAPGERMLDLRLPDGRPGRAVERVGLVHHHAPAATGDDPGPALARIVVAVGRAELDGATRGLLAGVVALGVLLTSLLALVGPRLLGRGLRPLERLAGELAGIEAGTRTPDSLTVAGLPSELTPVAARMRSLTESLQLALERERRTTANIAHELRTPVAELRAVTEVALQTPHDLEATGQALGECREIAETMQAAISTLLSIARSRAAGAALARGRVDLDDLVRGLWSLFAARARERGIAWDLEIGAGIPEVLQSVDALRAILTNLFDNACGHCPGGGRAECRLFLDARGAIVAVTNDVRGLTPENVARLGEPFWRADESRSDREHVGLGLALSRECAAAAGLSLTFRLERERLEAALVIPISG
jgi:two-component system sensor histidine kinase QseC